MSTGTNNYSPKKEEFTYSAKGQLIITTGLQKQIDWLHKQVGRDEWCGILFYKVLEGKLDDPASLKIEASSLYLMDIGNATYTSANMDAESVIDMWETVNSDYSFKRGMIHTHHDMATFFSGTDMSELHDNAGNHNYYLSLIVNFAGSYSAKVAYVAKRTQSILYREIDDEEATSSTEKEVLVMIDMNIIKEQEEVAVPDFFRQRYTSIRQTRAPKATQYSQQQQWTDYYGGYGTERQRWSTKLRTWVPYESNDDGFHSGGGNSTTKTTVSANDVNKEGNIQKGGKTYSPVMQVNRNVTEKIMDWLNLGTEIYPDMTAQKGFDTIGGALSYFEDYFNGEDQAYEWFKEVMSDNMAKCFAGTATTIVRNIGMDIMDMHANTNYIAADLSKIFDAYPTTMAIQGTKNKKNNNVHARRK